MNGFIAIAAFFVLCLFLLFVILRKEWALWLEAWLSRAPVRMRDLLKIKLRRVDPRPFVQARMMASATKCDVAPTDLLRHHLAGGRVSNVVEAVVAASRRHLDLTFEKD